MSGILGAIREEFQLLAARERPDLPEYNEGVSFDGQRHWVHLQAQADFLGWIPVVGNVMGLLRALGGLSALTVGTTAAALVALKKQNWEVVYDIAAFGAKQVVIGAREAIPLGNTIHFAYLRYAYKGDVAQVRERFYSYTPVRSEKEPTHFAARLRCWMSPHSTTSFPADAPESLSGSDGEEERPVGGGGDALVAPVAVVEAGGGDAAAVGGGEGHDEMAYLPEAASNEEQGPAEGSRKRVRDSAEEEGAAAAVGDDPVDPSPKRVREGAESLPGAAAAAAGGGEPEAAALEELPPPEAAAPAVGGGEAPLPPVGRGDGEAIAPPAMLGSLPERILAAADAFPGGRVAAGVTTAAVVVALALVILRVRRS